MRTMEWMNPKIMPKRIETNKKRKMLLTVAMSGTIREAKRQAKMPVAPKEKSIRPEFKLLFKAKAATRVKVKVLTKTMMFLTVPKPPVGEINKVLPAAEAKIKAIKEKTTGTPKEKNNLRPKERNFLDEVIGLRLNSTGFT